MEYALVVNNEFKEIRNYAEKPANIPHKKVEWFPVVRATGETFAGVRDGAYVISTPAPEEAFPGVITPRQARLALLAMGLLEAVNEAVAKAPTSVQIAWEFSNEIRRDDTGVIGVAKSLGMTDEQIDNLFIAASKL